MSSTIISNSAALNPQRNIDRSLDITQQGSALASQGLSASQGINGAPNVAAAPAIPDLVSIQKELLNGSASSAASNANNGVTLTQVASNGLNAADDLLQRVRDLAVQSADTDNNPDRSAIQNQASQLLAAFNQVVNASNFNNQNLLDGQSAQRLQVSATASVPAQIPSVKATDIGRNVVASNPTPGANTISSAVAGNDADTLPANNFAAQTLTISSGSGDSGGSGAVSLAAGSSAKIIAAAVNGLTPETGVTASASTTATISDLTHTGDVAFQLSGANASPVTITATISDTGDLSAVAQAINQQSSTTNITAVADKNGNLKLNDNAGDDIGIKNQGAAGTGLDGASFQGADNPANGSATPVAAVSLSAGSSAGSSATVGGQVTFSAATSFTVSTDKAGTLLPAASNASNLNPVSAIDLGSSAGATDAIASIDAALTSIGSSRSALEGIQNQLVSAFNSSQSPPQDPTAGQSRVRDSDSASATAGIASDQIQQQPIAAIQAQANVSPNGVLALLRDQ